MRRDLTRFDQLTLDGAGWDERLSAIRTEFPSVDDLDWEETFAIDIEMMGRIIGDLVAIGQRGGKGRSGPRKSPEFNADSMQELRELFGLDYSMLDFPQSLSILGNGDSNKTIHDKTGLPLARIRKLVNGDEPPTMSEIIQVAHAYKKRPSYFADYRVLFVASRLATELERNPEYALGLFKHLRGR